VRSDGSYDVDYDDGEVETAVSADMARAVLSADAMQDQEEEIKALKIKVEANAKMIAELETLLAAYRQPTAQPDNSGKLLFVNIRIPNSQLVLSPSLPDGSKSLNDKKRGDQTQSNEASLVRSTEAAAVDSDNSAAVTTVVQYPMWLVDNEKKSPGAQQRQSPLRLGDSTATETSSISDNASGRFVNLLAMPEEELQAVINEVNQQLRKKDRRFTTVACSPSSETESMALLKLSQYVESSNSNSDSKTLHTSDLFEYEVLIRVTQLAYITHSPY
jgi:hypothetical protein